eukprot:CAMPEP_0168328290 /NCGR_PEP_ID=MMETSP0213-20121227/6400_1 /TAXON_ID=151035 /ORGANISM="Euplotes harpa, Strain FSP1.4" /LENGTH=195 /DNA_ID=CAMNT_0008331347 /DNA_START=169 /DNA_END=756 /DNA_ORIENTATION=-
MQDFISEIKDIIDREEKRTQIKLEIENDIFNLIKELKDDERESLFASIQKEEEVKVEYSDTNCTIVGDGCHKASLALWYHFKNKLMDKDIEFPPEWENLKEQLDSREVKTYEITPQSHPEEYKSVFDKFHVKNNYNGVVKKIERIQNVDLFENYYYAKKCVRDKYKSMPNVHVISHESEKQPNENTHLLFREEQL